ncbi:hypothetical protein LCGC14_0027030 [marine sediment metagenome]|uniref:Uncharacterized protein n=1 Tax=marine sediment metagenome TaxID=412755 RepID=A0A0F9VYR1_9ZZZZ
MGFAEGWRTRLNSPWLRRGVVSAALLAAVALWVEPQEIMAEVQRFSAAWVALAFAISTLQIMLCAWRWQFTAGLIDVPLRFAYALREYYLALLVNQLLPGGVLGDAGRAHRHATQAQSRGRAWRAVIIERASGQVAVGLLTLTALLLSPLWHSALGIELVTTLGLSAAIGAALVIVSGLLLRQRLSALFRQLPSWCQALARDVKRGLLQRGVWPRQLLSSLVIVLSYGLVMVCAARAIGVELPALQVLALTPVLLLAMLIPFSVAGWGLREGAAAGVWALVGLPPAQGVAVSLAYGVLVMLASLPGIWVALSRRESAQPSGGSVPQQHVKQGVVATAEVAGGRAQRTLKGSNGRHLQPWSARADQQRRHQQVQPVDGIGLNKLRDRDSTTFNQHTGQAFFRQQGNNIGRTELTIDIQRQYTALNMGMNRRKRHLRPHNVQRGGGARTQQCQFIWNATPWVKHHPGWVSATHVSHRELRVVRAGSASTDHHCVDQGAQSMQMHQTFMTVDVVGVAALRRNTAIKTLPQLSDNPLRLAGQRCQAVQQFTCFSANRLGRLPFAVGQQLNGYGAAALVAKSQQPLPGIRWGNTTLFIDNTSVAIGVGHDASALKNPLYHAGRTPSAQAHNVPHASKPGGLYVPD